MASTVWKGYITFGLISIPIRLFTAARSEHVAFHQVHAVCNTRIKQQLYCPTCERVVERSELVKGYEVEKGQFVQITDEEVKKIAPPSTDTMEISEFVKIRDIDPLYYESSYYALPEEAGKKAYQLLLGTMEKSGYAALAKVGMHRREYIVVIRPREHGLTLHTMYYPNEVRAVQGYGATDQVKLKPQEIELAEQLIKKLAAPFQPDRYQDEYRKHLLELVEAKSAGKRIEGEPKRRKAPVIDLMQALQKSLSQSAAAKKPAAHARGSRPSRARRASRG
ncbi:MAG: Ku protein [Acidobacteria bacterium]|jgi:DNA end-binding protein Ku|nr:MAG: Ku protein [Acidobacteriota bacterium]